MQWCHSGYSFPKKILKSILKFFVSKFFWKISFFHFDFICVNSRPKFSKYFRTRDPPNTQLNSFILRCLQFVFTFVFCFPPPPQKKKMFNGNLIVSSFLDLKSFVFIRKFKISAKQSQLCAPNRAPLSSTLFWFF